MSEKVHFILGDKLPTAYDAGISLFSVAIQPETNKITPLSLGIISAGYPLSF